MSLHNNGINDLNKEIENKNFLSITAESFEKELEEVRQKIHFYEMEYINRWNVSTISLFVGVCLANLGVLFGLASSASVLFISVASLGASYLGVSILNKIFRDGVFKSNEFKNEVKGRSFFEVCSMLYNYRIKRCYLNNMMESINSAKKYVDRGFMLGYPPLRALQSQDEMEEKKKGLQDLYWKLEKATNKLFLGREKYFRSCYERLSSDVKKPFLFNMFFIILFVALCSSVLMYDSFPFLLSMLYVYSLPSRFMESAEASAFNTMWKSLFGNSNRVSGDDFSRLEREVLYIRHDIADELACIQYTEDVLGKMEASEKKEPGIECVKHDHDVTRDHVRARK